MCFEAELVYSLVSSILNPGERGKLISVAQPWKLRSREGLLACGLMVAPCDVIDFDCHRAQLGVIAWRQIKDYIVSR